MTFLEKYEILKKSIPVAAVASDSSSQDCNYADNFLRSKNCFYSFDTYYLEDSAYVFFGGWSKRLFDCSSVYESEMCFECIDCDKCNSCTYSIDCTSSTTCHYSALLISCSDCFGCVGLTNKKYCILNNQLTKEQYKRAVRDIKRELEWKS